VLAVPRERERNLYTRERTTQINRKTKRKRELGQLGLAVCERERYTREKDNERGRA